MNGGDQWVSWTWLVLSDATRDRAASHLEFKASSVFSQLRLFSCSRPRFLLLLLHLQEQTTPLDEIRAAKTELRSSCIFDLHRAGTTSRTDHMTASGNALLGLPVHANAITAAPVTCLQLCI